MTLPKNPTTGNRLKRRKNICHSVGMGCDYTTEEVEFMLAIDRWKRDNHKSHPTFAEVLAIAKVLGYRKVTR